MSKIYEDAEKRIDFLNKVIEKKTKSLEKAPQGSLRISKTKRRIQYYHRLPTNQNTGIYLPKTQNQLIRNLAQKEYDKKVLEAAERERRCLQKHISSEKRSMKDGYVEEIYLLMSEERKSLVKPLVIPDEQFIREWLEVEYDRKSFREDYPEYYTENGERVRSKSEVIIANLLKSMDIPYRYECPITMKNRIVIYPDFTILDIKKRKTIYLEHLGMMDELGYNEKAMERIELYEENNIMLGDRLFITYETRKHPLNVRLLRKKLRFWLNNQ